MHGSYFQTVVPVIGVLAGLALTIFAFVKGEEIARMMGVGAALVVCNTVFLSGYAGTWFGAVMILSAVSIAIVSVYAMDREYRRKQGARTNTG